MAKMGKPIVKVFATRLKPGASYKEDICIVINTAGKIVYKSAHKKYGTEEYVPDVGGEYRSLTAGTVKADKLAEWVADPAKAIEWLKGFEKHGYELHLPKEAEKVETPQFANLREKIAWEKEQRRLRYQHFSDTCEQAHLAGMDAGGAAIPTPMVVQEHENPLDDNSPVIRQYAPELGGVCGFAWVTVRNNRSFAYWAKEHGWRNAYNGGIQLWISQFGQSMTRKEAYARAYAEVLTEAGIEAIPGSRMD